MAVIQSPIAALGTLTSDIPRQICEANIVTSLRGQKAKMAIKTSTEEEIKNIFFLFSLLGDRMPKSLLIDFISSADF